MTENDQTAILNQFYELLIKECSKQKISIKDFFTNGIDSNNQDKILLPRFNQALIKLGYLEGGDEISIIMNKFQNQLYNNYIDLELIEKNCEDYKEQHNIKSNSIFTKNPDITLKNLLTKGKKNNKIENEENQNNTNKNINIKKSFDFKALGPNVYVDLINEKIENENLRIKHEMENDKTFRLKNLYFKLYSKLRNGELYFIMQNKFYLKDKTLIGYITKREFSEILDDVILLSNSEIDTLFESLPKAKGDLYNYEVFLETIKESNEKELIQLKKDYNINYNNYIRLLRNIIQERNLDLRNMWVNAFGGDLNCNKSNFNLLFEKNTIGNFHPLESEYIFSLINPDNEILKFRDFCDVINKKVEDFEHLKFKDINTNNNFYKEDNIENPDKIVHTLIYKNNNNNINNLNQNNENNKVDKELLNEVSQKLQTIINKNENSNINNYHEDLNKDFIPNLENKDEKTQIHYKTKVKSDNKFLKSSIRNQLSYDEIKYAKDNIKREEIIANRLEDSNENIESILDKHEKYIVLNLYKKYYIKFSNLGNEPMINFSARDSNKTNKLKINDFMSVLNVLKCETKIEKLEILLNSLNDKDSSLTFYSYKEFLNNVYNFRYIEDGKIDEIYYEAQTNFNNYILDFKKYILINKVDVNKLYLSICPYNNYMLFKDFFSLCNAINYKLSHVNEYKYIFNILSKDKRKEKIFQNDFYFFIENKILSEEKFLEKGKCQKIPDDELLSEFDKKIPKYGESNKIYYKRLFKSFEDLFQEINIQCNKYGVSITTLFSKNCEIDNKGSILKETFKNICFKVEIKNSQKLNELTIYLEDDYNRNKFKLMEFLGIFYIFYPQIKEKKLKNKNQVFKTNYNLKQNEIMFSNNIRNFSKEDINQIKRLCIFIADIINNELHSYISDFFKKFAKYNSNYLTIKQLKNIIDDELGVDISDHSMDVFFDYVTENEIINNQQICLIDKLINIIINNNGGDKKNVDNYYQTIPENALRGPYTNMNIKK